MKTELKGKIAEIERKRREIATELHAERDTLEESQQAREKEIWALCAEGARLELLQKTGLEVGAEIEADVEFLPGLRTKVKGTVELRDGIRGLGGVKIGMLTYPFHGGPKIGYYIAYEDLHRALSRTRFEEERRILFRVAGG